MSAALQRLVGVYNANGTVLGEIAYVVGRSVGRAHCALCDITHGTFRRRPEWDACRERLGVPFETYHRDDQPEGVRRAASGIAPVVLAEFSDGRLAVVLDGRALDECGSSPEALMAAIEAAVAALR
jgi:hypothetical protein